MTRRRHYLILAACLCACMALAGEAGAGPAREVADPGAVFAQARTAYDDGRYEEAAAHYAALLDAGYRGKEVLFNLGNAQFRNGEPGRAVLNYRRAWYLAPRDEDVRTNLGFALDHTGALAPDDTPVARTLRRLALREWVVLATVLWWSAWVLATVVNVFPRARWTGLRVLGVVGLALVVSLAGTWQWARLAMSAEMVVVAEDQVARYAPLEGADTHFELPAGSIVQRSETSGDWLRIGMGGKHGWVPKTACEPVSRGGT